MNETTQTPYASPSADLVDKNSNDKIRNFKRFSAWGVFGLSMITLGIYPIYWLWTRSETINSMQEGRIAKPLLIAMVVSTIISTLISFIPGEDPTLLAVSGLLGIAYFVFYLMVLFKVRNSLQDIMSNGSQETYKLNGVYTFFANVIYLQYKINECIDSDKSAIA